MKGLLLKDYLLITARRSSFLLYLIIIAVISMSGDRFFAVAYGMFLFGMIAISTIAYDEIGGGMEYLMTLPVTASDYVAEKHVFCFSASILGFALSSALSLISLAVKGEAADAAGSIAEALPLLFLYFGITSAMIYIDIKAGIKKSRTVMIIVYTIVFSAVFIVKNLINTFSGPDTAVKFPAGFPSVLSLTLISLAAGVVLTAVFYCLSLKTMNNKEY